jgi:hypothetical protein
LHEKAKRKENRNREENVCRRKERDPTVIENLSPEQKLGSLI